VIEAVWSLVTGFVEAVNAALIAPAATVAVAGTLTAALLLASDTVAPAAGAAFVRATVQAAAPPLRTEAGVQLREASCARLVTVSEADRDEPL
jgi:hypothetical protein